MLIKEMTAFLCFLSVPTESLMMARSNRADPLTLHFEESNSLTRVMGIYDGDIMLAGFIPIHQNGYRSGSMVPCGDLQEQDGIEFIEALFYTLDEVNSNDMLPGFKLGATVFDTCSNEMFALEQGVELLRFLMTRQETNNPYQCSDGSMPILRQDFEKFRDTVGIVGAASSGVTLQLASLMRLFQVPQVSHLSTSSELSNKERFPYFWRTVPSDTNQARAIVEVLKEFNWTYVSVVYDDSSYGTKGYGDLSRIALEEGICFASSQDIDFDNPKWGEEDYNRIVTHLIKEGSANVVVVYADLPQARALFEAMRRVPHSRKLIFVGSDAWSGRALVTAGLEDILDQTISVQPLAYIMPQFDSYFKSLRPNDNTRNPWFIEYWERHFNCSFRSFSPVITPPSDTAVINHSNVTTSQRHHSDLLDRVVASGERMTIPQCTGEEVITEETGYAQLTSLHFMHDAVMAYATTLAAMHTDLCHSQRGLCPEMHPTNITGPMMKEYLDNTRFNASSGFPFAFTNYSDGPARYTVKNFRLIDNEYQWKQVGTYSGLLGEEEFMFDQDFRDFMPNYPTSTCQEVCQPGQIRQMASTDSCCWTCSNCSEYEFISMIGDSETCKECQDGYQPDKLREDCFEITPTFVSYADPWAIGALVFGAIGVVCVILVFIVFFKFVDTPVIKASGRELSLVLLGGILLSFLTTLVIMAPPSPAVCGLTRILIGLCYTICYAALLTKTNRIARIFSATTQVSPKKTKYTSSRSQIVITTCMVLLEIGVISVWLAAARPSVSHVYPERHLNVLVCEGAQDARALIPLIFPFLLLISCTVYAFKTRKTPDGFNETRYIAFTSYTTCIIWLAFMPLYFIAENFTVRCFVLSVALSSSATVSLGCMFVPKVYICVFRPQKNTREAIMARTSSINSASIVLDPVGIRSGSNAPASETQVSELRTRTRSFLSGNNKMKDSHSVSSLPVSSMRQSHRASQMPPRVTSLHCANPSSSTAGNTPPPVRKSPKHFNRKDLNLNDIRIQTKRDTMTNGTYKLHKADSLPDNLNVKEREEVDTKQNRTSPYLVRTFQMINDSETRESSTD